MILKACMYKNIFYRIYNSNFSEPHVQLLSSIKEDKTWKQTFL